MAQEIFKAYDIRGTYPQELDEGISYLLGRAFVSFTKAKKVVVGEDMRESSQPLKKALVQGITDQGADVIDVGLCSTSMFYFIAQNHDASIMVTASHNPKEYNGFKLCRERATPISGSSGIQDIKELVMKQEFSEPERKGTIQQENHLNEYISFCTSFLQTNKEFSIVVDTANGMGGYTYTALQKALPQTIKLIPLYWELDGSFPNHEANPLKEETLGDVQQAVQQHKADVGVAIDGDGDRIVFIDEKGRTIGSALIAALISEYLLSGKEQAEHKGAKILYDLRSSKILPETIQNAGGRAVESRVGHAFIKKTMREEDILFGAEVSGHLYHKEMQYTESEIIPLCRVLNILSEEEKPLSERISPFRKYPHIPETNFTVEDAQASIATIQASYAASAQRTTTIDGLKMEFEDWWFSLRASNTEPLLRLNLEADNQEILEKRYEEIRTSIQQ